LKLSQILGEDRRENWEKRSGGTYMGEDDGRG